MPTWNPSTALLPCSHSAHPLRRAQIQYKTITTHHSLHTFTCQSDTASPCSHHAWPHEYPCRNSHHAHPLTPSAPRASVARNSGWIAMKSNGWSSQEHEFSTESQWHTWVCELTISMEKFTYLYFSLGEYRSLLCNEVCKNGVGCKSIETICESEWKHTEVDMQYHTIKAEWKQMKNAANGHRCDEEHDRWTVMKMSEPQWHRNQIVWIVVFSRRTQIVVVNALRDGAKSHGAVGPCVCFALCVGTLWKSQYFGIAVVSF